jgi:hypothetical protein
VTVAVTAGYSFGGRAVQGGVALGTYDSKRFFGYGASSTGLILSLSIAPGNPPAAGSWTNSYSFTSRHGIGVGYENGSFSGQFGSAGGGVMRNYWFK